MSPAQQTTIASTHGQDQEVEHEVAPEAAGVGRAHPKVVTGEVIEDRVERRQDVKDEQA